MRCPSVATPSSLGQGYFPNGWESQVFQTGRILSWGRKCAANQTSGASGDISLLRVVVIRPSGLCPRHSGTNPRGAATRAERLRSCNRDREDGRGGNGLKASRPRNTGDFPADLTRSSVPWGRVQPPTFLILRDGYEGFADLALRPGNKPFLYVVMCALGARGALHAPRSCTTQGSKKRLSACAREFLPSVLRGTSPQGVRKDSKSVGAVRASLSGAIESPASMNIG